MVNSCSLCHNYNKWPWMYIYAWFKTLSSSMPNWNANEVIIKKFNQCYMHEYTTLRLQLLTGTDFSEF